MSRQVIGLALIALCWSTAAAGQLHRCEVEGHVTYTDQPCRAGEQSRSLPREAGVPSSALDLDIKVSHYDVSARDYPALVRALAISGPRGFHGLARWAVSYRTTQDESTAGCSITSVRVTVAGEILMPRWVDAASASPELQRQWSTYLDALQRHEEGHIQHGRELALLVKERLMGLGRVACDGLEALARREFERLYANLRSRDQEYDRRTGHGRTQGAFFAPP